MWVPLFHTVINTEVVGFTLLILYISLLHWSLSSLIFVKLSKMTASCLVCCSENVTFKRVCSIYITTNFVFASLKNIKLLSYFLLLLWWNTLTNAASWRRTSRCTTVPGEAHCGRKSWWQLLTLSQSQEAEREGYRVLLLCIQSWASIHPQLA